MTEALERTKAEEMAKDSDEVPRRGKRREENEPRDALTAIVGELIRRRREERGMGVMDLARAAGVEHDVIYRCETGRKLPSVHSLLRLTRKAALDVELNYFLAAVEIAGQVPTVAERKAAANPDRGEQS